MKTSKLFYMPGYPLEVDQLQWLKDARALRERLLQEIKQAKRRIYITALYLENDDAGREVFAALIDAKKHNPNLDIKLFVDFHRAQRGRIGDKDGHGSDHMYRQMLDAAQVTFEVYGVPVKTREIFGVLHLKGFIMDETLIYSGASINDIYLHQHDRYRLDRYHVITQPQLIETMIEYLNHVLLTEPKIQSLLVAEKPSKLTVHRFIRRYRKRLMQKQYRPGTLSIGNRVTPLVGLGKRTNVLNKTILRMLRSSKEAIFMCTPYFNPPTAFKRALGTLLRAGIQVDMIVGDKKSSDFYIPPEQEFNLIGVVPYIYEQSLRRFLKKYQWAIDKKLLNVYVWKHDDNSFHLKGLSVDNRYHMLTGNNLNPRAWALDLENALLIHDDKQVWLPAFAEEKQRMLQHAKRMEHYTELETMSAYEPEVVKILKRLHRFRISSLVRKIL